MTISFIKIIAFKLTDRTPSTSKLPVLDLNIEPIQSIWPRFCLVGFRIDADFFVRIYLEGFEWFVGDANRYLRSYYYFEVL